MVKMILICVLAVLAVTTTGSPVIESYDSIVIGLGPAGIATASSLAKAGRRVLALEAQDCVGGETWTKSSEQSIPAVPNRWNHARLSGTHKLSEVLKMPSGNHAFPKEKYSPVKKILDFVFDETNDQYSNSLQCQLPESLETFMINTLKDYVRQENPEAMTDQQFKDQVQLLVNLITVGYEHCFNWASVGPLARIQYLSWGRREYNTLFDIILFRYENHPEMPLLTVKLNTLVKKVTWSHEGGGVSVDTADGKTYTAENVVVTESIGGIKLNYGKLFSPPLPQEKIHALNQIDYQVCEEVLLQFEEQWWHCKNCSFIWNDEDKKKHIEEDSLVENELFPSANYGKIMTVWFCDNAAKKIKSVSEIVVANNIMKVLKNIYGQANVPDFIKVERTIAYNNLAYSKYPHVEKIRSKLEKPVTDVNGINRLLFAFNADLPSVSLTSAARSSVEVGFNVAARIGGVASSKEAVG